MSSTATILLLVHLLVPLVKTCPFACKCTSTSVSCILKNLENVPNLDVLQSNPLIIDLSGNKINIITDEDFTFDRNAAVVEIYLNNSEVLDIDSEAFVELENLQELYLGENLLRDIPKDIIEDLPNMILLELSRNLFSGDMPLIKSKSLEVLALANCKISSIPENALKQLPNLKMLLLQQNNIKHISKTAINGVSRSLALKLFYNPFECTCSTFEILDFLSREGYVDKADPYQCSNETSTGANIIDIFEEKVSREFTTACLQYNLVVKVQSSSDVLKNIAMRSSEKPYSLIIENHTMMIKKDTVDVVEHHLHNITNLQVYNGTGHGENVNSGYYEVVILLCIFFIGLFIGCFITRLVSNSHYIKLHKCSDDQLKFYGP